MHRLWISLIIPEQTDNIQIKTVELRVALLLGVVVVAGDVRSYVDHACGAVVSKAFNVIFLTFCGFEKFRVRMQVQICP